MTTKNQQETGLLRAVDGAQYAFDCVVNKENELHNQTVLVRADHLQAVITAATEAERLRSEVPEWLPITEMPDGKSFLVAEKIMMQDGYFEPQIIYRNGGYYFREDRTKANVSGLAVYIEIPAPTKSTAQAERDKTRKTCGHSAEHFDDTDEHGQVMHDEPLNKG